MNGAALTGGFANPPVDAAQAFRQIMTAMARPGDIRRVTGASPPAPLSRAAGVLVLTLCDPETPLFLAPDMDVPALRDWITFHTGAPIVAALDARFAIGPWGQLPIPDFPVGTPKYPDRSATLIVETGTLAKSGATLRGPGIRGSALLSLPETDVFQRNAGLFPLGIDFFFTQGDHLAALPRTTQVTPCM